VPEDDALRTYRVSRIESAEELDQRFDRPLGFTLAVWWRESSAQFEQLPMRQPVKVRLTGAGLRRLTQVLGPEYRAKSILAVGQPDADGWAEAELVLESRVVGLGQLTALGGDVEILEPADLRESLAEIGAAVAARNAPR
jgi:predicted DNA-binding transcriptional regulator YafY